jgi:dolichol-phosphate mannosyltransferase
MNNNTLIFIPTYNERENVEPLTERLDKLKLDSDILFLDDNSPDGTGKILDELSRRFPRLSVLHGKGKFGIGNAHKEGIRYAYRKGYSTLITMDCDFTHSPEDIPRFLNNAKGHDIVVGSRYLQKNSLHGWNLYRKTMTTLGHFLTKNMLGLGYDATGAFRLYHLSSIAPRTFDLVYSNGYSFFFESLFILNCNGYAIKEISIILPPRTYGSSKMSHKEVLKSIKLLFSLYFKSLFRKNCLIDKDIVIG